MELKTKKRKITGAVDVAPIFRAILDTENEVDRDKEHFWAMGLNTKNQIQYLELVSLGVLDASLVHPREVFRFAVMKGVARIVLVHNHPSGDPTPSPEDVRVTEMMIESGRLLDIEVMDHLVIGRNRFVSLKERGLGFK